MRVRNVCTCVRAYKCTFARRFIYALQSGYCSADEVTAGGNTWNNASTRSFSFKAQRHLADDYKNIKKKEITTIKTGQLDLT